MIFNPDFTADGTPDDASLLAMRVALRDLKVFMHPLRGEYLRRAEMLNLLTGEKMRIERIDG
jgi:predicted component of type VI protein secretion system